jgi:hypothetical protein
MFFHIFSPTKTAAREGLSLVIGSINHEKDFKVSPILHWLLPLNRGERFLPAKTERSEQQEGGAAQGDKKIGTLQNYPYTCIET